MTDNGRKTKSNPAGRLLALLLIVAACLSLFAGCGKGATLGLANTPLTGQVTPALSPNTTPALSQTPGLPVDGPQQSATPSPAATYTAEELNGIARADDVLPVLAYEEARAINADVIGWIAIPGTTIDYPVVRGSDNEYYLGRNVEKKESSYGSVFMDFRNADPEQQRHIILYGHNMKNGTMFHDLMNYKQKDFFNENRFIYFTWDGVQTVWEIYLATIIPFTEGYTINYIGTRFSGDDNFTTYMADMMAYAGTVSPSIVDQDTTITAADQVLTLSTCTYEYDDSFFAVQAKRIK